MGNVTVIGAQWGDEGKGKIVDWLASRADMVVRFQGGHNAGHTLVVGSQTYKLSLLPSGIVRGTPSVIGNGVVLDPWAFKAEVEKLAAQGVSITPDVLMIAETCPLILPIHRDLDALREDASGAGKIGTTRRGIGPAYEDKVGRRAIRVCDLAHLDQLDPQLDRLCAHHDHLRAGFGQPPVDRARLKADLSQIAEFVLAFARPVWREVGLEAGAIDRRLAEAGAQVIMMRAQPVELRGERIEVRQVAHPDRAAANLVLISRADTAPRGPDLARARCILAQGIEIAVNRQDQWAGLGDHQQLGIDLDPLAAQFLDFGFERPRIEHHAIANDRRGAGDDPRRQQRQFVDIVADNEGVPSIMSALEADHHIGLGGEPVDDLALALIAPLRADDGDVAQA